MRTCTSQLCPERGGSVLGKREGGLDVGERESRSRLRRKRSGEAGDGRGQLTADALNLTDGEG